MREDTASEDSAFQNYSFGPDWLAQRKALAWDDLLKRPLVVILGEPGSGKTYEMQEQAIRSSPECPRFYFRLDELAGSGARFEPSLGDSQHIAQWINSPNRAVFFLDSVDEAKIHHASDFHRALDRFIELIGRPAIGRANIVISSRITEWLPTADGHALRIRFPSRVKTSAEAEKNAGSDEAYPFVVNLLPLAREAVTVYAKARGVADAEQFLDNLDRAHAWDLARRPADVNDLIAFWRETGELGTLTEILSFVCESQLRKTSDRERSELLALERARSGARCLAATTILCRKFIFQIPGETNPSANAIDALACLPPDWRNEEVRALLNHALFDGASYGHIRFHHRRLSEFLAAQWFEALMARGCPIGELEELLFDARGSGRVLRPSLAPIAAWLCAGSERWNIVVCRRVLELSPEILLRYGDPARLPLADRRQLLKALLRKADGRERLWWEHEDATLSRLTDPSLAPEISELITTPSSGRTLRELGLEMVIAGRLTDCAPAVLALAVADLEKGEDFPTVARAIEAAGSETDLRALAMAARAIPHLPERVCVPLCKLLFPKVWSVSELFRALSRMKSATHRGIGWDYTLSEHLASVTTAENGLALLNGLLGHPVDESGGEDEFDPPWSLRTALAVSGVMLDWRSVSEAEASAIAEVLVRAGDRRSYLSRDELLPERTARHPRVRERYFRLAAERLATAHGHMDAQLFSVLIYYEQIKPTTNDLKWILRWLETAPSESERKCALQWAFDVWQQTGRAAAERERIKRAAKTYPETKNLARMYFHPGLVARAKALWYRRIRHRFYRYRWRMIWRKMKQPYFRLRDAWNLWRHRGKMRSGEYVVWLANLASEACGESRDQWAPRDWLSLEKKRGKKCAAAVKEGCMRVWERHEPPLPHDREPNRTSYYTIAGLAGIMSAWREGTLRFSDVSFDDARRATRYALSELNGFPPWFDDLISTQPAAVRSVLAECVSGEWKTPVDSEHHHLVLYDLAWTESAAGDLIKPVLLEQLAKCEPENSHVLRDALCILVAPPSPASAEIAALAERRCLAVPVNAPSFPQWAALWLQADAMPAIGTLEARLASATDPTRAMASICANLGSRSGYRLPVLQTRSWLTPAALRRFIPLVYRYIRREDDIDRSGGGAYSPTARDDAQEFRGGLLERLVATGHPDVESALQGLLSEPLLSHLSDYMRHLLEKHRDQLADGRPWRAADVRTFATEYERDPQTDADLYRIGLHRLLDLKRWVEEGEDSPREEVNRDNNEAGFRRWLQPRLNERAKGRYVVPQEWEIDQGARPDLRLVIPDSAPVSLELKIADNWTIQQLLDGLEKQLVDTYLRDHRARYGIYVLALFERSHRWRPLNGGTLIDCEQMVSILSKRIQEILAARANIAGLEVVLIHFGPPGRG